MMTLTYFIKDIFSSKAQILGNEAHQTIDNINITQLIYKDLTISGSLLKEIVFEDVIFENCTFFGSEIVNCLFLNCLFIKCKFQFSKVYDCNFEQTSWENCIWGRTSLEASEMIASDNTNSYGFHSEGLEMTCTLNLNEFLSLTA